MAERHCASADEGQDGLRQGEQAQHVRYGRSLTAHSVGNLLLRQRESCHQRLVPFRFFNRVQVASLQILDECQSENCLVIEFADVYRNFSPS